MYGSRKSKYVYSVEADNGSFKDMTKNFKINCKNNYTLINKAIFNIDDIELKFGKNLFMENSRMNDSTSQIYADIITNEFTLIKNSLLKINKGLTTTAQIFNVKNIDKIINLIENSDVEIDNTYNELENKYCVYPMCVYQRNSYSDINKKNIDYGKFHQKYIY